MLIAVDRRAPITTGLPFAVRLCVLGIAAAVTTAQLPAAPAPRLLDVAIFASAAAVMSLWSLQMPGCGGIRIVDALYLGALLVVGPDATVAIAALGALVRAGRDLTLRPHVFAQSTWEVLQAILAVSLAGTVFAGAAGHIGPIAAVVAAAVVLAVAQATLTAGLRAALEGVRFYLAMIPRRQVAVYLLVLAPLGLLFGTLYRVSPSALGFLLLPIAMMYRSLKNYTEVLGEARATIEDMALAVERRDPCMAGHADRVSRLSGEIAREMRVAEEDVEAIVTAGRLHDLGKISVPDNILLKAGRLGEDEFEEVKAHTLVGGKVVAHCSLVQRQGDVASLIRQHHERHDGRGYPDGLKGDEILLGARILAVAEAWDTMTTPRTWRVVLTPQQAHNALMAGRGTQFDPRVVDAFLTVVARKEAQRRS